MSNLSCSYSRIATVEHKIDRLAAQLAHSFSQNGSNAIDRESPSNQPPSTSTPTREAVRTRYVSSTSASAEASDQQTTGHASDNAADPLAELAKIHDFDNSALGNTPITVAKEPVVDTENDKAFATIFQDLVTEDECQRLLDTYRSMVYSFPFVPLPEQTTVEELRRRRPMLLLAMLTAASWQDRKLQSALESRYRHELADRAIIHPRKNLTLVQSLLIYLAW